MFAPLDSRLPSGRLDHHAEQAIHRPSVPPNGPPPPAGRIVPFGNVPLLILNLPLVGLFVQILRVPYPLLTPAILLLCLIGAYSVTGQAADALTMVPGAQTGPAISRT